MFFAVSESWRRQWIPKKCRSAQLDRRGSSRVLFTMGIMSDTIGLAVSEFETGESMLLSRSPLAETFASSATVRGV